MGHQQNVLARSRSIRATWTSRIFEDFEVRLPFRERLLMWEVAYPCLSLLPQNEAVLWGSNLAQILGQQSFRASRKNFGSYLRWFSSWGRLQKAAQGYQEPGAGDLKDFKSRSHGDCNLAWIVVSIIMQFSFLWQDWVPLLLQWAESASLQTSSKQQLAHW